MANTVTIHEVTCSVGDQIKVHYAIQDKDKKKNQIFEGIIMDIRGRGNDKMFTVRKVTKSNIGVERIFPIISPFIAKVEVEKAGSTRRSNIKFIRTKSRKEIKEKIFHKS